MDASMTSFRLWLASVLSGKPAAPASDPSRAAGVEMVRIMLEEPRR